MEYTTWFLIEDIHEWEAIGGEPTEVPDEFPVLATQVGGYTVTVNYDTAKLLTDVYEDGSEGIPWVADDEEEGGGLH